MKLQKLVFSVLLLGSIVGAQDQQQVEIVKNSKQVKKCACGPTEHWFYACCVTLYNQAHPEAQLIENDDTQGLSQNIINAITMLAKTVVFVDDQGILILPELTAKGNRVIFLSRNAYYKACKALLHELDESTTDAAEDLYDQWMVQLQPLRK